MKNKNNIYVLAVMLIFGFLFLNFGNLNQQKYMMMNDIVIKRLSDGALYQKGIINLKFKTDRFITGKTNFGISSMDNVLAEFIVNNIEQRHPLNPNYAKRKIGDEILARIYKIEYNSEKDPSELAVDLFNSNRDILDWAEPDYVMEADFTPNDPNLSAQWFLTKISAYQGWDLSQGDTNVVIGMVDSGSDLDHPDLAANIKFNWLENPTNNVDDDANGYVDDWRGWDFAGADYQNLSQDNDPNIYGSNCDHGSHTSGCASEVTNNGIGGAGVGFKTKLLICKHGADNDYTGGGVSYMYNTNSGITYAYQNNAKVINCSFGSSTYSGYTQTVVNTAWANGSITVASAGNAGTNTPRYPASYDNVVSVASTGSGDVKSWFSNYHTTVDICAPGESIYSTLWNNTYTYYDGTSMSAPIVSGTVALIKAKFPSYTPQQVVDKLKAGVDDIYNLNPGYIGMLGTGRVNVYKCLTGGMTLQANFTGSPTNINPGGSVNFTDQSTGSPTTWTWTFPGGTPGSSTVQNPTGIVYNTIGSYDVTLQVGDGTNTSSLTKPNYIVVSPVSQFKLEESFELTTFPPTGWTKINPLGGSSTGWYRIATGTTPVPGFQGGYITSPANGGSYVAFCNYITGNATGGSSGPCDQWLITKQVMNIQPTDTLSFWLRKFGNYLETFQVKISTTTPTVAAMTISVMNQNFLASDSGWVFYKYALGSFVTPGANIYIGFREYVANVAIDGASFSLDLVKVSSQSTGITINNGEIPSTYSLEQNYPNPFNPETNIKFGLPKSGNVKLAVYDISGKEVAVLLNEFKQAGSYTFNFNGSKLSSGVYFYRIISENFIETKRMILVK
jgi:subtilisin family serine protease